MFEEMIAEIKQNGLPTFIYGAGELSSRVYDHLKMNGIHINGYVVDKEYWQGKSHSKNGLPVYAAEAILPETNCNLVIGIMYFSEEKEETFSKYKKCHLFTADYSGRFPLGIEQDCKFTNEFLESNHETILELRNALSDDASKEQLDAFINQRKYGHYRKSFSCAPQYFEREIISPVHDEVFIDCGAFDGDTIKQFAEFCNNEYKRIIAYEADEYNYKKMKTELDGMHDVIFFNNGVSDKAETVYFSNDGRMSSHISDTGVKVEMVSIDQTIGDENVTFIKMDIEGSELKALMGAEKTILRCRPRLAICVYHRLEDILTIPQYIQSLDSSYMLYFRNYHSQSIEAVIYAI